MVAKGSTTSTIQIFISYSYKDEALREELESHLSTLKRLNLISQWHRHEVFPGTNFINETYKHIYSSNLILLLVSADFIASDYCYSVELEEILKIYKEDKAWIIPIILRPVDWEDTPFGKLEPLPANRRAITSWLNRDEAYFEVVQGIKKIIEKLVQFHSIPHSNKLKQGDDSEEVEEVFMPKIPISTLSKEKLFEFKESLDGRKIRQCKLSIKKLLQRLSGINMRNMHNQDYKMFIRPFNDIRKNIKNIENREIRDTLINSIDQLNNTIDLSFFYLDTLFDLFQDVLVAVDKVNENIDIKEVERIVEEYYTALHKCKENLEHALQCFLV